MAIVYFDSSALVKLLVEEDGSDLTASLWDGCDAAVSSRLAYPEVHAALAAAGRSERLAPDEQAQATTLWERFWESIRVVELTEQVGVHAGALAATHALRGADAIHLASALAVGDATVLAVWDRRLHAGAVSAGLRVAPAHLAD